MNTKQCSKCNQEKTLDCFGKCSKSLDGLAYSCKQCDHDYYEQNKEYIKKKSSEYYHSHQDEVASQGRQYRNINKMRIKAYLNNNKEHIKQRTKQYYDDHKETIKLKRKTNHQLREKNDSIYKMKIAVRRNINNAFRRRSLRKGSNTEIILGCNLCFFLSYIESKFTEGMTWDNYGIHGWHLDHIIPLCTTNTEEGVIKLNHYTNFQPLWAEDNYKKKYL